MNQNTNKTNAVDLGTATMRAAGKMALFMGIGFSGIVIIPTLSILAFVLTLVGIGVMAIPFINLIGSFTIPFYALGFLITGPLQIVMGIMIGGILIAAGFLSGYGLKKYVHCIKCIVNA